MARYIHLQPHLSVEELERRYRAAKEPSERSRWQILWLLSQSYTAVQIAAVTGYSAYWIGQIAKRYNTAGPAGMANRRHTTSHRTPPLVPPALQEELRQVVAEVAARHEYWTGSDVAAWISARLGHAVSYHVGRRYLVRAKQRLRVPPSPARARRRRAARRLQKNIRPLLRAVASAFPRAHVELWATDEHRIGLKPLLHRVWAHPLPSGHHRQHPPL